MKKIPAAALIAIAVAFVVASSAAPAVFSQNQNCTITFITESIADSFVGVPYEFQLEVCCGTPPYQFKIVEGGLPPGLSMDTNGLITGTPTEATNTTVFIRLKDRGAGNCTTVRAFSVTSNPAE